MGHWVIALQVNTATQLPADAHICPQMQSILQMDFLSECSLSRKTETLADINYASFHLDSVKRFKSPAGQIDLCINIYKILQDAPQGILGHRKWKIVTISMSILYTISNRPSWMMHRGDRQGLVAFWGRAIFSDHGDLYAMTWDCQQIPSTGMSYIPGLCDQRYSICQDWNK